MQRPQQEVQGPNNMLNSSTCSSKKGGPPLEKVTFTYANSCHLKLHYFLEVTHYIENAQFYSLRKKYFANRASYSASWLIPAKFLHFSNKNDLLFQKKSHLPPPMHLKLDYFLEVSHYIENA